MCCVSRIRPNTDSKANASGFSNLVLAGDWIDNGYNAGCVEAATWSGIQAANALLGLGMNDGVVTGD